MAKEHLEPIDWLLSEDVGQSSESIFRHFMGKEQNCTFAPSDRADFGRCMRLLESPFAAGWSDRITEMNQYVEWAKVTPHWTALTKLHYAGKFVKVTAKLRELLR